MSIGGVRTRGRTAAYGREIFPARCPDGATLPTDAEAIGTRDGVEQWRCSGREEVRADWADACARLTFCIHHLTNEEISVAGPTAEGRWCYFEPATNRGTLAAWTAGRYHHTLTERDGEWRFSTFRIETLLQAPYDLGWVPDPIVELA